MKYFALVLILLIFTGCDMGSKISPNQDISVQGNKEEAFKFDSKIISIKVNDVNDSRCPENAQCIRAGEALVTFDIIIDGTKYSDEKLCIICEPPLLYPNEKQFGNYTLTLKEVKPYPTLGNQINKNTVVFQMR
jgi:hypothetical protein